MSFEIPSPLALLYDWDNTLVDTWPVIHQALNVTLRHFDKPEWTYDETKARVRLSMRDSFPALFGDRWEEAGQVFYDAFETVHLDSLTAAPGADAFLDAVRTRGLIQGVVSNKRGRYLRAEAAHLGWGHYFSALIGAGDAARDKPATDPVAMALSGPGLQFGASVWFVGDSGVDMQIAHAAKLTPVLIRDGHGPLPAEFDDYPPAAVFPNLEALHQFLTAR